MTNPLNTEIPTAHSSGTSSPVLLSNSASAGIASGRTTPEVVEFDTRNYPIDPSLIASSLPIHINIPVPLPVLNPITNLPQATVNMATTAPIATITGPNGLPIKGQRGAPTKFTGRYDEVVTFIQHYERVCAQKQVTSDQDLIENITQYCSRKVREFMEGLDSFKSGVWALFKSDILKYYDAERDSGRYRISDLEKFVTLARLVKMKNLPTWKTYNRDYIRIAGWLTNHGKLPSRDKDLYFWKGIHKTFRTRLAQLLLSKHNSHDMQIPWEMTQVCDAADMILQRGKFENDRLPSDTDSDSEEEYSDSDSESESSSTDSESELVKKKSGKKSFKSKKASRSKKSKKLSPSNEMAAIADKKAVIRKTTPPTTTPSKEVEELINKLNQMSIEDPKYAGLYFRACQLNPAVKGILESLALQRRSIVAAKPKANDPPPFKPNNQPPRNNDNNLAPRTYPDRCFGCGEAGHITSRCPALMDLLNKGVVKRDPESRRYVRASGEAIFRRDGESLIQAINRPNQLQSHFVQISDFPLEPVSLMACHATIAEEQQYDSSGDESDDESEEDDSDELFTFEVIRTSPQDKRIKAHLESEPIKILGRAKRHNIPPVVEIPVKTRKNPKAKKTPTKENDPTPVPFEPPPPPVINPPIRDIVMEEAEVKEDTKKKKESAKTTTPPTKELSPSQPVWHHRQSELQSAVNTEEILQELLATPVTMQWGKVIAISPVVAQRFQSMLRPKRIAVPTEIPKDQPFHAMVSAVTTHMAFKPHARGSLIYIPMLCGEKIVTAIIDTGSQLNIASSTTWESIFAGKYSIDISKQVIMNDANGGHGVLHGYVQDVHLHSGGAAGVETHANIWIGKQVPFDLLLGRPWQRGNLVSIDERSSGTFLLFKGMANGKMINRFELMVTPEPVPDSISHYMANLRGLRCNLIDSIEEVSNDESRFEEIDDASEASESYDSLPELLEFDSCSSDYEMPEAGEMVESQILTPPANAENNFPELANHNIEHSPNSDNHGNAPHSMGESLEQTPRLSQVCLPQDDSQTESYVSDDEFEFDSESISSFIPDTPNISSIELSAPVYANDTDTQGAVPRQEIEWWEAADIIRQMAPPTTIQELEAQFFNNLNLAGVRFNDTPQYIEPDPNVPAFEFENHSQMHDPSADIFSVSLTPHSLETAENLTHMVNGTGERESEINSDTEPELPMDAHADSVYSVPTNSPVLDTRVIYYNANLEPSDPPPCVTNGADIYESDQVSHPTYDEIETIYAPRVHPFWGEENIFDRKDSFTIGPEALIGLLAREWRHHQRWRRKLRLQLSKHEASAAALSKELSALLKIVTKDLPYEAIQGQEHDVIVPWHGMSLADCEIDPLGPRAPRTADDHSKCLVRLASRTLPPQIDTAPPSPVTVSFMKVVSAPRVSFAQGNHGEDAPIALPPLTLPDPLFDDFGPLNTVDYTTASVPRHVDQPDDWLEAALRQELAMQPQDVAQEHVPTELSPNVTSSSSSSMDASITCPTTSETGESESRKTVKKRRKPTRKSKRANNIAAPQPPTTDLSPTSLDGLATQIARSIAEALRTELRNDREEKRQPENSPESEKHSPPSRSRRSKNSRGRNKAAPYEKPASSQPGTSQPSRKSPRQQNDVPEKQKTVSETKKQKQREVTVSSDDSVPPPRRHRRSPRHKNAATSSKNTPDLPEPRQPRPEPANEATARARVVVTDKRPARPANSDTVNKVQQLVSEALKDHGYAVSVISPENAGVATRERSKTISRARDPRATTSRPQWHYRREPSPRGLDKALPDPLP